MSKTVYRTTFVVEVFHDELIDMNPDVPGLGDLSYLITEGPFVGNIDQICTEPVRPGRMASGLLRLSEHGSFRDEANYPGGSGGTGEPPELVIPETSRVQGADEAARQVDELARSGRRDGDLPRPGVGYRNG